MDLSNFFQTKTQAEDFSERISKVAEKIYETDFNLEETLADVLGPETKEKFLELLKDEKVNLKKAADFSSFLDKVRKEVTKMEVLTLTIAIEPTEHLFSEVTNWFVVNLKKQILFDVKVDKSLSAGAIIDFNGKHMESSIKPKIESTVSDIISSMKPPQSLAEKEKQLLGGHQSIENISFNR